jgi:microcystin-dependent protein
MANSEAAVSGGRGANADSDWAANKTIALPDLRGRVTAGKDNMGGSAASRVTTAGSGIDGATLGATGGAQSHTLTTSEIPAHTHRIGYASGSGSEVIISSGNGTVDARDSAPTGGGTAHNNMPPGLVANYIIKT